MSLEAIAEDLGRLSNDPEAFVLWAFPWGEPGTELERWTGVESWQGQILRDVRDGLLTLNEAIQIAAASGHGVGKSALVSWLILWGISTFEDTRGVVTANTETQLKTKTWAELGKWHRLFIASDLFTLTATALFHKARERTWRIDMVPWSERNTEAFAGLHNQGKRVLLFMDEASAIPDIIHETAEGALTDADTQILWFMFGNPTRNSGRFKAAFDGPHAKFWKTYQVDSRSVSFTNKEQFKKWLTAYGEDSDFFRIRVRGVFPRQGEMEFFSASDVDLAMSRDDVYAAANDPLSLGVDVARFGANNSVIFPRKGRDARSIPRKVFNGLSTVALANEVYISWEALHADGIMIDGGGVGGGVVDNVRARNLFCFEVQFGGKPDQAYQGETRAEKYANKRAEMYGSLRAWLKGGALPLDSDLRDQMLAITYTFNVRDEIILTSKEVMMKDGKPSPDDLDALCLTFAYPLAASAFAGGLGPSKPLVESEYDPYDPKRMAA